MIEPMHRFLPLALLVCAALWSCSNGEPLHGTVFSPPLPPKRFTLIDQKGSRYVLAAPTPAFTALYFGFTHCKDVCPQTLVKLERAREEARLTPAQLQIVMVSVDPALDSPAAMRAFFTKLRVQAIGLTGSASELQTVYRAYGVAVQNLRHDIGHSDYVYILDKNGRARELLSSGATLQSVAADLRTLVE